MKKVISIMLCLMVGVSCFALSAFAEGEPELITTVYGHTYQEGDGVPAPDNVRNISGDFLQSYDYDGIRYTFGQPFVLYDGDYLELYDDGTCKAFLSNKLLIFNSSVNWKVVTGSGLFRYRSGADTVIFSESDVSACNSLVYGVSGSTSAAFTGSYASNNELGYLIVNYGPSVDTLEALNVVFNNNPLQFLVLYNEPYEVVPASYMTSEIEGYSLMKSISPFVSYVLDFVGTVSSTIILSPVLLLSFGFFLIGGMIGLCGRMLSRG